VPTPPPPPSCGNTNLGSTLPGFAAGSTVGKATVEVCGVTGPGALFTWTAPGAGPYSVTVAAAFPLDVAVADGDGNVCLGPTVACGADDGATSLTTSPGRVLDIVVVARDGVGGSFTLGIGGPAPFCGDGTCDVGEDCSSCAEDCGACPAFCGDGTCDFVEDCTSCPEDCGACPSFCGDGICDVDEDCASCGLDCGTCAEEPCQSMTSRRAH